MNFFVLAPLTAAIINSFLGVFVFLGNPRAHANRVYLFFSIGLSLWNFGVLAMFFTKQPETALFVSRALHIPVIFLLFFLIHIVLLLFNIPFKKIYYAGYLIPISLGATAFSSFIISDVTFSGYSYYGIAGPGFYIFTVLLATAFIAFIPIALKKRKKATGFEKQKIHSVILAYFVLLFSGLHDTLPVFEIYRYPLIGTTVYPLGTIGSIVFAALLAYGVLQHQILNIYTSLGRIAATCARLFLLFMVFYLSLLAIALIFPNSFSYFSLFSSILLFLLTITIGSVLFPKLIGIDEDRFEKRLLGDRFEYQDKIRKFSKELLYYDDEASLFDDLKETLVYVFGFQTYCLFTLDERAESFYLHDSHPKSARDNTILLPVNSAFMQHIEQARYSILNPHLSDRLVDLDRLSADIKEPLRNLPVKLCFRLKNGTDLLGFLMIGEKSGDRPITNFDLTLLLELTSNLGLFINQARLKKQIARSQEVELLGNLSRGLAHDLNNLITPIFTYCQLTEDAPETSEDLRSFAAVAKRNLHAMQSYVRESLFFSTNHEPKLRPVNVAVLLRQLHGLHEAALTAKGVDLKIVCPESLEMNLDDVLIQRLLSNLIHNALDASPENSVIEIIVTNLTRSFQRRKWVRITIQDHGIGIPEDQLEKIFTPYFTTKGTGDNRRGAGLGLPICRRIVDLHQGSISVSSKVSAGTRIDLDLPSALTPAPTSPIQSEVSAVNTDAAQQ